MHTRAVRSHALQIHTVHSHARICICVRWAAMQCKFMRYTVMHAYVLGIRGTHICLWGMQVHWAYRRSCSIPACMSPCGACRAHACIWSHGARCMHMCLPMHTCFSHSCICTCTVIWGMRYPCMHTCSTPTGIYMGYAVQTFPTDCGGCGIIPNTFHGDDDDDQGAL